MDENHYEDPALASEMDEKEREIAQWRIDVTPAGEFKLDEIYAEFWAEQPSKQHFGKVFKAAVTSGMLKGIKLKREGGRDVLAPDRQILYIIR